MIIGRTVGGLPSNPLGLQGKPPTLRGRVLPESTRSWYDTGIRAEVTVRVPLERLRVPTDPVLRVLSDTVVATKLGIIALH